LLNFIAKLSNSYMISPLICIVFLIKEWSSSISIWEAQIKENPTIQTVINNAVQNPEQFED